MNDNDKPRRRKSTPKPRRVPKEKPFCAERLTTIRLEENLTQEQLAEKLGVDKQMIYRIESGKIRLSTDFLQKICQTLDVSADYFFLQSTNRKGHKLDKINDRQGEITKLRSELACIAKDAAFVKEAAVAIENRAKTLLKHPLLN